MFPFPLWEDFFPSHSVLHSPHKGYNPIWKTKKFCRRIRPSSLNSAGFFLRQRPSVRSQYGRVPGIALRGVNSWPSLVALWCGGTEKVPSHIPSIPRPGQSLLLRAIGRPQIDAVDAGRAWPQDGDKHTTRSCSSRSRAKSMG